MSSFADRRPALLDGHSGDELARRLALPMVMVLESVGSTLDVAHGMAVGSESGTLIIANEQTAGRGRHGRRWHSRPGDGLWLTLVERPTDARSLDVLALRCGLFAAEALQPLADGTVGVKWPNDLYIGARKLAGILIETRWRGTAPDWVAIGFGLNVRTPDVESAVGLSAGVSRLQALERLVPALRAAATSTRHLAPDELARWSARDVALGRPVSAPAAGQVAGIERDGQLVVQSSDGVVTRHRTGSLTFAD